MTWLQRLANGLGFGPVYRYPARDIALTGHRHLHLVGSIHMGSPEMVPLPQTLQQQVRQSDALIVEVDVTTLETPFTEERETVALEQRLHPQRYQQLQQRCESLALSEHHFTWLPAWQVALALQATQAQALGLRHQFGIDYQLIQTAKADHIPVIELEGQQAQLRLLRQMRLGGEGLLEDTLEHWHTNTQLLQMMMGWWLASPPRTVNPPLPATFNHELTDILMRQRNLRWCQQLQALPSGRYVVAVGALHLYGDDNLPALLQS